MASTTRQVHNHEIGMRVVKPASIPINHKSMEKGWEYVEVKQTDRSKGYSSNRTKSKKKKHK